MCLSLHWADFIHLRFLLNSNFVLVTTAFISSRRSSSSRIARPVCKVALKKDKKPKKSTWKFNLDLTHPVEDGSFDSGNFGTFPSEYLGFSSLVWHFFLF